MKKSILSICAIAAALLLAGCQKENINVVETAEATHTVVFTAEKMVDTKTAIASEENGMVSYKWIAGDENRMYITENYQNGEQAVVNRGTVTNMELTNADKTATFTVSFTGTAPTGDVSYKAAYAGQRSNANNPLIPSEQNPLPTSFDPNADVMVCVIDRTGREGNPTTLHFDMTRKVSVNKMTLKGLEEGEIISSVTFESDKNHSAYYNLNSGEYTSPFGKKLTFNYTDNNTVTSTGEFPVYFTTVPVTDATFTVSVVTNRHYYNKTSSRPISFELGNVRRFNVNLEGRARKVFTLVTDPSQLQIGAEVVIAADGDKKKAMSTTQNTNNRGVADITKSDDWSTMTITDQVQVFTLVAGTVSGTYSFSYDSEGTTYYLYAASSSDNYLRSKSDHDADASWTISISDGKYATVIAQGENSRNVLRYNSQNNIFSCYTSGQQQPVFIYQASALPYPGMFWSAISATASMTTSSGIVFTAPTLNPGNATSISYDSSDTDVATIDASGAVTIIGAGTTTISAIFEGNSNYAPQTVTYTLTVTDDRETVATPTFNPASGAVDANTTVAISTQTSGATIHYTTDGSNPTTSSPVYSAPIVITSATTINAIAIKENYKNSGIATASYSVRGQSVNVWEDDFSKCTGNGRFTILYGSVDGFKDKYSDYSNTFNMPGAIRIGTSKAGGYITTPSLTRITASSANLTVTFKAAGWKGKTAKLELSVNNGSVTEGQTTIQSENSMSSTNPSMTGTVYTFHITGANNTTKITFTTTCSIGIDDLVVTQTN